MRAAMEKPQSSRGRSLLVALDVETEIADVALLSIDDDEVIESDDDALG